MKNIREIGVPDTLLNESGQILAVYSTIEYIAFSQHRGDNFYLSLNELIYNMYGISDVGKSKRSEISKSLKYLLSTGYLLADNIYQDDYIINKDQFSLQSSFARVYFEDIRKILCECDNNKFAIVKYYCNIMKSRDGKTNVGNMPHSYFENKLGISYHSCINYMSILENLHILYVKHDGKIKNDDCGNIYKEHNIYGHYSDRSVVDFSFSGVDDNRYKKSMAAKYNQVVAGKVYDDETMIKMYNYFAQQNEKELLYKQENPGYVAKIRDLSVFNLT